ncbi:MAG: DUF6569 family protein [Terracidiphilus sp.]|jgi:hypothetical protein
MKNLERFGLVGALLFGLAAWQHLSSVEAAGGPGENANGPYRALAPIESGNLLLFPVVRADQKSAMEAPFITPFITLDEGLKSGEVEVTEAGRARGLVRLRGNAEPQDVYRGDEVNTLVLVNHSKRPLILLAGEVVTGGKQDRIVAKDRIVPADADPIDLSVFCIEPGRWTESSAVFGTSDKSLAHSFMVQPAVRERAMVDQDQQQVWDSVNGTMSRMEAAAVPSAPASGTSGGPMYEAAPPMALGTTSYAKMMQNPVISQKVDEAAAPVMKARDEVLTKLRDEHAVGVVVAVRGEIVWVDLFASTDLLARYWTKLVRSYAAESLTEGENHSAPSVADAEHFLDMPSGGTENSEGEVGIYRYRELKSAGTETFVLESLLPHTGYVHISKMKLIDEARRAPRPHPIRPHRVYPEPNGQPPINPSPISPHPIYEPQVFHPGIFDPQVVR